MALFLEVFGTVFAVWFTWWLVHRMLRPRAPAEPADDPFAPVRAPVRHGPKGRGGAVALEEPDENDGLDYNPPRSI